MKILYITTALFRNESASIRNMSLINGLIENGVKVEVLTIDVAKEDIFLINSINKKVNIKKIPMPFHNKITTNKSVSVQSFVYSKKFRKIKNILVRYMFFPDTLSEALKTKVFVSENDYDYIISSSDSKTSHLIAEKLIKDNTLNIPWIQIWGDPWANDIGLKEMDIFSKLRINYYEKKLLKKADKIFYISKLTADSIKKKFPEYKNKIYSLTRSYFSKIETEIENSKYIFTYTGTILNRNIIPLIKEIKKYNENNLKKIELQFYGINKDEDISNYDFIKVYPRVSLEKVLEVYKKSNVLVYIDNLGETTQIPGKIYDYFGTNKVILGLYENENIKKYLEKFNRIEFYKNQEKEINLDEVISKIGTKQILEEFSPKNVAKDFISKYEVKK